MKATAKFGTVFFLCGVGLTVAVTLLIIRFAGKTEQQTGTAFYPSITLTCRFDGCSLLNSSDVFMIVFLVFCFGATRSSTSRLTLR